MSAKHEQFFRCSRAGCAQHMNDIKNFLIAYFSTASSVFAAIEARTVITIISAIVLPVMFFAVGKAVDVLVQIYLDRRSQNRER